jgi:CheY-like chemotaxis protein
MENQTLDTHVLLDVRGQPSAGLEDVRYLEMVGFRVTDTRDLPLGLHAAASVQPDVIMLEFSSAPAAWTAVREFRITRRTAQTPIAVYCGQATLAQHEMAHRVGADAFLSGPLPGLEWVVRGVCAALAFRGRSVDAIPGFERRARLGATLCAGTRPREARVLVIDDKGLPLFWQLVRSGYAATPADVTTAITTLNTYRRPDVVVIDADVQPDAVTLMCRDVPPANRPRLLCVADAPAAASVRLGLPDNDRTIQVVAKPREALDLARHLQRLVSDYSGPDDPGGPHAVSKRLPIPSYRIR